MIYRTKLVECNFTVDGFQPSHAIEPLSPLQRGKLKFRAWNSNLTSCSSVATVNVTRAPLYYPDGTVFLEIQGEDVREDGEDHFVAMFQLTPIGETNADPV